MSRDSQKKKQQRRTSGLPTATQQSLRLPPDAASFRADKAILVSQEAFIRAGAPSCFDLIVKRLEGFIDGDPMILEAKPITNIRRVGAVTHVTMNVGGSKLDAPAVISSYEPDRVFAWALTSQPKVKEYWRLQPERGATLLHVTFGCEMSASVIKSLLQSIVGQRRLKRETRQVLGRLKEQAEATGSG